MVSLRRTFTMETAPSVVPARACAVSVYTLRLNGTDVARGPLRSNPHRLRWDEFDLAPHLRSGDNVIEVTACRYEGATPWWMPGPEFANDLVHGAFVFEADLGDRWLVTDGAWEAAELAGWVSGPAVGVSGRGTEVVDARGLPDAEAWEAALVRRGMTTGETGHRQPPSYPGGPLAPRYLSWPTHDAVDLPPRRPVADRIVVGTIEIDVEGPPGAEVTLHAAEFLGGDGTAEPNEHDAAVRFVCDGSRRTLRSIDRYGLHGVSVDAGDDVTVHRITVAERLHPVTGGHTFECSDPLLETIWQVGRRTVTICSLDAYIDCPTREQRAWTGDSVVHQMVDLATNDDWTLARWHPELAASPRADGMLPMAVAGDAELFDFTTIPDWALHWVHSVHNLYRYAGNRDEIGRLLPVVEGVVRWFERFADDTGAPLDVTGWVIVDWSAIYTDGVSAALCGLWGRALLEFAEMAEWLEDRGRARWARAAHARLAESIERLWDPDRRLYVDSLVNRERRPMTSQHAQASMIVGDLAPRERHSRLVEVMTDESRLAYLSFGQPDGYARPNSAMSPGGPFLRQGHPEPWWDVERDVVRAQPFFRYVVHDAIVAAGRADLIPGLCRDWALALEACPTSWAETWFGGTVSHGWSSTPTRDLVVRTLGIEPLTPGFVVARIAPSLGDLAWARGSAPCGPGRPPIRVEASRERVSIDSPVPFEFRGRRLPAGTHRFEEPDGEA